MSDVRATVFGKTGARLAEIEPDLESVKWSLNRTGRTTFSMAYTDPKCKRDILKPGNRLLLEFSCGLPDWGGVIEFPLGRRAFGVAVTAWGGERLLGWRVTGKDVHFNGMSPGAIFQYALELENTEYTTGISTGNIYAGGAALTMQHHYYDLLRRTQELTRLTGEDFAVSPRLSGGKLSFLGHWYQQRGRDVSGKVLLAEGRNVTYANLDGQGPVANVVYMISDGVDWGNDRPVGFAIDDESVQQYGYREYAEYRAGVTDESTLDANAAALLETMKQPRNMISLTVCDETPGRFADYDVGDVVATSLFTRGGDEWGYDEPVRVIAREWHPDNTCVLEVAEWA